MTFVPPALLLKAVDALRGAHPLAVVTLPALLRAAARDHVDPVTCTVEFGSSDETGLLREFFTLPRPPERDRPYRAIWAKGQKELWQTLKYPGGGLQRMRRDQMGKGRILIQAKGQNGAKDRWGLTSAAGSELAETSKSGDHPAPIRLVDLALWFGRKLDVSTLPEGVMADQGASIGDLDRLVAWFKNEFQPDRGDLVGSIYDDSIPPGYRTIPFAPTPVGDETYEALGSVPPAPNYQGTLVDLVHTVEQYVRDAGFTLSPDIVRRVMSAWFNGNIVILVGQPGTGKSMFASLLAEALQAHMGVDPALRISVRADFDEAEFLGYERLDGSAQLREFAQDVLLTDEPLAAHVVILEEMNLALVENYLSSVLVATQETERTISLPSGEKVPLPVDTFIIGTCNSYRDEPETRVRISSPTKRRAAVITMPNVLSEQYETGGEQAIIDLAVDLVKNEAARVEARLAGSSGSQFDQLRYARLSTIKRLDDLSEDVRASLSAISKALLETPTGASWFTAGLLRDVALSVAQAERNAESELEALGAAVADKLVHQLRGTHADIQEFRAAVVSLPNAEEIHALTDRMMDGPSDELVTLV